MVAVAAKDVEKYTKKRIKNRRDHFNPPLALQRHEQNDGDGDGDADNSSSINGATAFKNNRNHSFNL